jgi:hypothetical protein
VGVLGAAVIALAALLFACGDDAAPIERPPAETDRPAEVAHEIDEGDLPDWARAFEWTDEPSIDDAPDAPVRGVVNGRPFEPVAIFFEPRFGNWALVIANRALPEPHALLPFGTESANITDLPRDLAVGTRQKSMSSGGGFFQILVEGDDRTTSWNAPNAYALELTKWDLRPFDGEAEEVLQDGGSASGRVVLVYEGTGSFGRAWVAGTFTDVPIRYRGAPRWSE